MNSSNLIGQKLLIGPKAFRQGSKTKKWQIEDDQLVRMKNSAKRRGPDLQNQESG